MEFLIKVHVHVLNTTEHMLGIYVYMYVVHDMHPYFQP